MALTYEQILSRQPLSTTAGNRAVAAEFVVFLTTQIEGAGLDGLTTAQKNYLYKLRAKWQQRAAGLDLRWNVSGSRPGQPTKRALKDSTRRKGHDPGEDDPLFQSLMRKYGTPLDGEH